MMLRYLLRISAFHFCADIVLLDNKVVEAEPVVGYMRGWSRKHVDDYCRQRGWKTWKAWSEVHP
jgi:hypothetical protein